RFPKPSRATSAWHTGFTSTHPTLCSSRGPIFSAVTTHASRAPRPRRAPSAYLNASPRCWNQSRRRALPRKGTSPKDSFSVRRMRRHLRPALPPLLGRLVSLSVACHSTPPPAPPPPPPPQVVKAPPPPPPPPPKCESIDEACRAKADTRARIQKTGWSFV